MSDPSTANANAAPGVPLTALAAELLAGPNFATVATKNRNGSLQQSIVWATAREGQVLFSTIVGRAKHRNLLRDPSISVVVVDRENPYRYVALRGTASLDATAADQLIDELSRRYTQQPWVETETSSRVNVVITVSAATEYQS